MTPAAYKDIVVECMKEAMCASGGASTPALRHNEGLSAAQRMLHVWSADSGLHHLPQNCGVTGLEPRTAPQTKGMLPLKPEENRLAEGEFRYRKPLRYDLHLQDLTVPEYCYS